MHLNGESALVTKESNAVTHAVVHEEQTTPEPEYLRDWDSDDSFTEYGLVTPDGAVHWGQYNQRPLQTPQDRFLMTISLRRTALELGFPEEEFVSRYSWAGRNVHQIVHRTFTEGGTFSIDDQAVAPIPPQPLQG